MKFTKERLTKAMSLVLVCQEVFGQDLDAHSAQNHPGLLVDAYYPHVADELRATHDKFESYKASLGKNSYQDCVKALEFYDMYLVSGLSEKAFAERYLEKKKAYIEVKYGDMYFDDTYALKGDIQKISKQIADLSLKDDLRHQAKLRLQYEFNAETKLLSASKRRELLLCLIGHTHLDEGIEKFKKEPIDVERILQLYQKDRANAHWYQHWFGIQEVK